MFFPFSAIVLSSVVLSCYTEDGALLLNQRAADSRGELLYTNSMMASAVITHACIYSFPWLPIITNELRFNSQLCAKSPAHII